MTLKLPEIDYRINHPVTADEFIDLLNACALGIRRPVQDRQCIQGMISNSNLMVSAWHREKLVGISRCVTDFHYACYLSDLAVAEPVQGLGIGKRLIDLTQEQLGPRCKILLFAAPDANTYYAKLGFEQNTRGWVLEPDQSVTT